MTKPKLSVDVSAGGGVKAITPSIWWVGCGSWGNQAPRTHNGDGNIFLVRGRRFDVLIDAGGHADVRKLEQNVRRAGGDPEQVGEIWLTHSHGDHSGGVAGWIARHGHVRCRAADVAAKYFRRGDYRLAGIPAVCPKSYRPPPRVTAVKPGAVLRCPPHEFTAVGLPGHTPDCLGYRARLDGLDVMFTGDAIIGDQPPVRGNVGWLDGLWLSDAHEYERMLLRILADPPELFLPGHGVSQYGPAARRSLKNCLWRIRLLLAIPHAHSMFPFMGR